MRPLEAQIGLVLLPYPKAVSRAILDQMIPEVPRPVALPFFRTEIKTPFSSLPISFGSAGMNTF